MNTAEITTILTILKKNDGTFLYHTPLILYDIKFFEI